MLTARCCASGLIEINGPVEIQLNGGCSFATDAGCVAGASAADTTADTVATISTSRNRTIIEVVHIPAASGDQARRRRASSSAIAPPSTAEVAGSGTGAAMASRATTDRPTLVTAPVA